MAAKLLRLGADAADEFNLLRFDDPGHARHVGRHAAVHLALEALDDLRPADLPPLFGGSHLLALVRLEDLGQDGIGVGLALVVVGGEGAARIGVEAAADGLDAQLVEHVLVVLFSGERHRFLRVGSSQQQTADKQKKWFFHNKRFYFFPKLNNK